MRARSFSHCGITVSDFNKAVRFYWDVFGCPLVGVSDQPSDRIRSFFGVDATQPTCKTGWIRVPGGAVIEIFEFRPYQPPIETPWNRVGLTHICFNVRNTQKWHDYLVGKGVEIVAMPEQSPNGGQWFFFVKDPDGNLIELVYHTLGLEDSKGDAVGLVRDAKNVRWTQIDGFVESEYEGEKILSS